MHKSFKQYLIQNLNLSGEKLDYILTHFEEKNSKKNEIIISKNKICSHLYFIKKGGLRIYCIGSNGQEWTRYVAFENEFVTIMPSFINQEPSTTYLQSIEISELLSISFSNFYKLIDLFQEWESFYRINLENIHINSIKRIEEFITLDAKHRYKNCLKHHPKLIQRMSNKILASYLGMSQETLSRQKSK
tara:strand:+ start:1396 stop:1962 length:567 start_codon:yes stop_codon:yes gene_type:complete